MRDYVLMTVDGYGKAGTESGKPVSLVPLYLLHKALDMSDLPETLAVNGLETIEPLHERIRIELIVRSLTNA